MSDIETKTIYRLTVSIEEVEIVDGREQTPEDVTTLGVDGSFDTLELAKAEALKLSGHQMEVIES